MTDSLTRYAYDYSGKVYTGEVRAMECLIDGSTIEPAFSTSVAPPAEKPGYAAQFNPAGETWTMVPDHRGEIWFMANAEPIIIGTVGDPAAYEIPLLKDRPAIAAPKIIPTGTSKLGLKRAFTAMGKWDAVKAAIASDPDTQEDWDLAVVISRNDPIVKSLQAKMDLSDDDVTNIIVMAEELVNPPASKSP
jgi:hypothetical protein